jgi:hypothetical protein
MFSCGFLRRWISTPTTPHPIPHHCSHKLIIPVAYGRVIYQTTLKIKQMRVMEEFGRLQFLFRTQNESPYFKRITACACRVKMKYRHENVRTKEGRKK